MCDVLLLSSRQACDLSLRALCCILYRVCTDLKTWKTPAILLAWKTPGRLLDFFIEKSGNPVVVSSLAVSFFSCSATKSDRCTKATLPHPLSQPAHSRIAATVAFYAVLINIIIFKAHHPNQYILK